MEGSNLALADLIKSTRRGLLVTFFWYIRPVDQPTLLNTGMTRDGLFLIENGEIAGPVQNFRWNMSPIVGFNNITALGTPVPIHTGESYDGPGTALVPPVAPAVLSFPAALSCSCAECSESSNATIELRCAAVSCAAPSA